MARLIRFILVNFAAGALLGAGVALCLVATGIGPGAAVAKSGNSFLATMVLVYSLGTFFGLGALSTAFLDRD